VSAARLTPSPRVVLTTGATSGIGQACEEYLASVGWRVFATGRNVPRAKAGRVERIAMDVNDEASVRGGVAVVLAKAGRLDAVVNNACFSMMARSKIPLLKRPRLNWKPTSLESCACAGPCYRCCAPEAAATSAI
jgi:NAD(P)-dependent dehydrogenase (short-subunit alcohol dehydrogenase family)